MKHTGGWFVSAYDPLTVLADDASKTIICTIPAPRSNESARADAHLIAAAPDLLEALEQFVALVDTMHAIHGKTKADGPLATKARAAIAKARGQ